MGLGDRLRHETPESNEVHGIQGLFHPAVIDKANEALDKVNDILDDLKLISAFLATTARAMGAGK